MQNEGSGPNSDGLCLLRGGLFAIITAEWRMNDNACALVFFRSIGEPSDYINCGLRINLDAEKRTEMGV